MQKGRKKKKILIIRCSSRQAGASVQVMWVFHPYAFQQSARCRRKNASLRCFFFSCFDFFQLHLQLFFFFFCPFNPQSITATVMSLFFCNENGPLCNFTTDTRSNQMILPAIATDLKQSLFYSFIYFFLRGGI